MAAQIRPLKSVRYIREYVIPHVRYKQVPLYYKSATEELLRSKTRMYSETSAKRPLSRETTV